MPRHSRTTIALLLLFALTIPSVRSTPEEAYDLYMKTSYVWAEPPVEDGIDLCYRSIFLAQLDLSMNEPQVRSLALQYFEEILARQSPSGEVMRYREGGSVNSKLMTGLGAWAMSVAYSYTGDGAYAAGARKAGDYLMSEMDEWEETYPAECDDPRTKLARNGGVNESSLTSYCWTSPNDLGLVALGIGSVVYYGAGGDEYYEYCRKLADALYEMQLSDGSWYDGYAYRIPTRWDRSTHYVTMAMMGIWMAYKVTGDDRYSTSLEQAWGWLSGMQEGSGAVYDIWVDDSNLHKAPENDDNRYDFLQVGGETNIKQYYEYPFKTFLGEFSLALSGAFMRNVGLESEGYERTKTYLQERMAISNWYLLSLTMEIEEGLRPYSQQRNYGPPSQGCSYGRVHNGGTSNYYQVFIVSALAVSFIIIYIIIRKRRENGNP